VERGAVPGAGREDSSDIGESHGDPEGDRNGGKGGQLWPDGKIG